MDLAEIYYIAETLGSAAVVLSLIFVGVQLRRNTNATRAASHHAITEAMNDVNLTWARDQELTRIWLAGLENRGALSREERWRFDSTLRAYLHVCETMYTQAGLGAGDTGIVAAEEAGIRSVFRSSCVREWWAENPFGFAQEFRAYVEKVVTQL